MSWALIQNLWPGTLGEKEKKQNLVQLLDTCPAQCSLKKKPLFSVYYFVDLLEWFSVRIRNINERMMENRDYILWHYNELNLAWVYLRGVSLHTSYLSNIKVISGHDDIAFSRHPCCACYFCTFVQEW